MIPANLTEHRAIEFTASQLAEAVTTCFEGYIMTFNIDGPGFERRFRPEGLDAQSSIILMDEHQPAAVCLIARQGWTSRVAAMAIAPANRRQGVGQHLMHLVIEEAKHRGDHRLVLEVIEQNPPAIGLYESVGMAKTRRLVGYLREPSQGTASKIEIIDPSIVIRQQVIECDHNLPWDYRPETLSLKGTPMKGVTVDKEAYALITDTMPERVIVWSLFTIRECRNAGKAKNLVKAIAAMNPEKALVTPIALPDDHAPGFMKSVGFNEVKISQFEMAIELTQ